MILKNKNFSKILPYTKVMILLGFIFINISLYDYNPRLVTTEHLPNQMINGLESLGDNQFLFRKLSLELQYMGDSYGRSSYVGSYDYYILSSWFSYLDTLDQKSNYTPSTAAYYFGYNYNASQLAEIVKYLQAHAGAGDDGKWWWLYQASYLAYHRMKDIDLAINIAHKLAETSAQTPIWVRQLPALYYAQIGEDAHALHIIQNILQKYKDQISPGEKNFMDYFINQRLAEINQPKVSKASPKS
ncbi:hypothetical protein [Rickettsiales endosymbiont of Stachyamoeba lipophora]|uniref:hypothetical protein n=1 Tax=Rickettsiales endosymbiont of Stachyamoeba lipophora TaxID=2486578 RepID=UPI000F646820|nr:hypothetical protein [Rickettsiales endosymbiont of Stachyamoeba lipophora]AZL15824.1 hypothetical protein EF513_04600 [Rickettsiales endosymbiont of Stachyamoeba lipophora]